MIENTKEKLKEIVKGEIRFDEPLSEYSKIMTGGKADVFVVPSNEEELVAILNFAKEENIEVFPLGAGSNVLFRDDGFEGIVLKVDCFKNCEVTEKNAEGVKFVAGSSVMISELAKRALDEGATGFECLAGIPGTVGGALSMNAGTHDGTISDTLVSVHAVDRAGRLYDWPKKKIEFGYRRARYPKSPVIISAEFELKFGAREEISKKMEELKERRKGRHPLSWPSLGSIFKNPAKGPSAGVLIDEAGLKGVRVGGARISNEHANWIINEGNATSKDVEILIQLVREKVRETAEVSLETEIVIIGKK